MGILELIIGLILFLVIADIVFSFVPIPRNILGTVAAILILYFIWRFVF